MAVGAASLTTTLAAGVFALAYLALAVPAALDRAGTDRPELAGYVPTWFRHGVLGAEARQLRDAGIPGSALRQAESMVRNDPLGHDSAGLLGVARLARGDAAGADAAFRVSAQVGWREPATQVYWFQTALAAGDYSLAALRFSAVARQWPGAPAVDDMASRLQATGAGEAALVARLASGEPWLPLFVLPGPDERPERLAARSDVLIKAASSGLRLGCERAAALVQVLIAFDPRRADRLWRSHCRSEGDVALLYDGGFDRTASTGRLTSFAWALPGSGALESAVVADDTGNRRIRAGNGSPTNALVLEQSVLVPPGRYRLQWRSSAADVRTAERLQAVLACSNQPADIRPVVGQWANGRHSVRIDFAGQCLLPSVQIWLATGREAIEIDDVMLVAD